MDLKKTAYAQLVRYFEASNFHYDYREDVSAFELALTASGYMGDISLDINVSVIINEGLFLVIMKPSYCLPDSPRLDAIPEENRIKMVRLLNQINRTMYAGNFEMPEEAGIITYRQMVEHKDMVVSDAIVGVAISRGLDMIQKYGKIIGYIAMDVCSIEEAMQMVRNA